MAKRRQSDPDAAPKRRPRAKPLPGMEDMVHPVLDRLAAAVADVRETLNDARAHEAGYLTAALTEMRKEKRQTFRAHGVEFIRVPGEEKLRVRTSKGGDQPTAENEDIEDAEVA